MIALIPIKDLDADIKKAVSWRLKIEGVVGIALNEAKSFKLTKKAVQVIFPRNSSLFEICSIAGTFKMGEVDNGKCPGHEGVNDRFPLVGKEFNKDEDKDRHAGCLRTEIILSSKIKEIALMCLQLETKVAKEILKGVKIIP